MTQPISYLKHIAKQYYVRVKRISDSPSADIRKTRKSTKQHRTEAQCAVLLP